MDLFELFGGIESESEDSLVEKPVAAKKNTKKKEAGAKAQGKKDPAKGTGKNSAKKVMFSYPVTVVGRNFKVDISGEGEVSLQDLAEKLYHELGYKEVAHERVRFVKLNGNLLMLDYQCLVKSGNNIALTLPVTIMDGLLSAVMEKDAATDEDEDEVSVQELMQMGLADELYQGISYDYDITSGIALPVLPYQYVEKVSINTGERIRCFGNTELVADPSQVVDQMMGELPEGVKVICFTGNNGHILYYKVESAIKLEKIDRSPFQVDETRKAVEIEEKIELPVEMYFVNFARSYEVTIQDMGGKEKVAWDELFAYIKDIEPLFAQADRKTDHLYDKENHKVSVALFSGRKGCVHPLYETEDGFVMLQKVPRSILNEVVAYFAQDLSKEAIVQVWNRNGEYYVVYPRSQDCGKSFVEYQFPICSQGIYVMAIHSHNTMRPVPSRIDDRDELQVPGIYGIIGSIKKRGEKLYYESFFRLTRADREPIVLEEEEIFEGGVEICA